MLTGTTSSALITAGRCRRKNGNTFSKPRSSPWSGLLHFYAGIVQRQDNGCSGTEKRPFNSGNPHPTRIKPMSLPAERVGWALIHEDAPSLCKHFMPISRWAAIGRAHETSNTCWCKPIIQTELAYTVVHHNTERT